MIHISLEYASLTRAEKLLAGIDGGIQKATKSAMSRAATHLKTISTQKASERYAVNSSTVRANPNVKMTTGINGLAVIFTGAKIPLWRYSDSSPAIPTRNTTQQIPIPLNGIGWRMVHPSVPARGHQLKGTAPTTFENAFVARMESGRTGIFERDGNDIREIMASSVPQMLGNEEVANTLADETMKVFEKRLEHEITRVMNGWGG